MVATTMSPQPPIAHADTAIPTPSLDTAQNTTVIFGTYRIHPPVLELAVRQAIDAGILLIDTAAMYGNEELVAKLIKGTPAKAGTKLKKAGTVEADLVRVIGLFGSDLERVLLHKPMPFSAYAVLEKARERGAVAKIGVCNYSVSQLEDLLAQAREGGCAPPDVVQNEFHPALNTPVAALCARHGIAFEAHSVMLANDALVPIAAKATHPTSPARLAILHARSRGAHALAITTTKYEHLLEDLEAARTPQPEAELRRLLTVDALEELSALPVTHPTCKYGRQSTHGGEHVELPHPLRLAMAQATIDKDIATFRSGGVPSDLCLALPKITRAHRSVKPDYALAASLAASLFGEGERGRAKLDHLLTRMRTRVEEARSKAKKGLPKCKIGPKDAIAKAEELPVELPDPLSFEALLQTLREAEGPVSRLTTAGAISADGRLDLCKQVVRPRFTDLVDAIGSTAPNVVSHLLVGNNIIFKRSQQQQHPPDTESMSAAPPSDVVDEHLKAFERLAASTGIRTFYLAGNGIDAASSAPIATALGHAASLEALYLKMNPISTGAYHFGALAARSPKLVLLDLFNSGLLDAGCAALAAGLAEGTVEGRPSPAPQLEHLYLNVNGLTPTSLPSLVSMVTALPKLQSLFLGENCLGDQATVALLDAVPVRPLARFELGSNALTDASLPALVAFVGRHAATLHALDLAAYKSTHYFRLVPNRFGDTPSGRAALVQLAADFQISYLGLDNCLPSRAAAAALLPKLTASTKRVSINARQRRTPTDAADEPPSRLQHILFDAACIVDAPDAGAVVFPTIQALIRACVSVAAFTVAALTAIGAARTSRPTAAVMATATAAAAALVTAMPTGKPATPAPLQPGARKIGNSLLLHTPAELALIRHPPQLQDAMSIYRNKM